MILSSSLSTPPHLDPGDTLTRPRFAENAEEAETIQYVCAEISEHPTTMERVPRQSLAILVPEWD